MSEVRGGPSVVMACLTAKRAFGSFGTKLRVEVSDLASVYPVFFDSKKTGQTLAVLPSPLIAPAHNA